MQPLLERELAEVEALLRQPGRLLLIERRGGHRQDGAATGHGAQPTGSEIALELAEVCAALFRWVDAADVIEGALADPGEARWLP